MAMFVHKSSSTCVFFLLGITILHLLTLLPTVPTSALQLQSSQQLKDRDLNLRKETSIIRSHVHGRTALSSQRVPQIPGKITSTSLHVASSGVFEEEPSEPKPMPRPVMEPPSTETVLETQKSPPKSLPPKVVVLGSTGKIGRRVIRQLMALKTDITIVAFVRDYERACDVLYDELLIERTNKGPKLQLVVMDLVPDNCVAGYRDTEEEEEDDDDDDDDDDDEEEFAVSAARFYKNDVKDYDFKATKEEDAIDLDPFLPLRDAISNATAIISTVGTVRTTLPFIDYLAKPWRIFLSPGKWCTDKRHPYYVNYMVHKRVLDFAEEAQRERNQKMRLWENNERRRSNKIQGEGDGSTDVGQKRDKKRMEKMRIVRISDHCLANPAWGIVNVLTNIFRSLVFRYQEKCEKVLSSSTLVDSVILRPGDLVDDIRNETTTTMSVSLDGKLPGPVYVGRDDVASLATLAAVSDLEPAPKKKKMAQNADGTTVASSRKLRSRRRSKRLREDDVRPRHWNIAVGWTGQRDSGLKNAEECMNFIVKQQAKLATANRRKQALRDASIISQRIIQPIQRLVNGVHDRKIQPYGFFVLLPMILFVYPAIISMLYRIATQIPLLANVMAWSVAASQPARNAAFEYVRPTVQKFIKIQGKRGFVGKVLIR